jgi:hypothetical protein
MSTPAPVWGEDEIDEEIMSMTTEEIRMRTKHIEEESRCTLNLSCYSEAMLLIYGEPGCPRVGWGTLHNASSNPLQPLSRSRTNARGVHYK